MEKSGATSFLPICDSSELDLRPVATTQSFPGSGSMAQMCKTETPSFRHFSRLERLVSLISIALLLTVTICLSVVLAHKMAFSDRSELCEDFGCVQAAASILQFVNFTADPCVDFYDYACGKWFEKYQNEKEVSTYGLLDKKVEGELKILFNSESSPNNDSVNIHKQVKHFFDSCMNTLLVDELGMGPLIEHLEKEQVLQYYEGTTGNDKFTNYARNIGRLGQPNLFFNVLVEKDLKVHPKNAIWLELVPFYGDTTCPPPAVFWTDNEYTQMVLRHFENKLLKTSISLNSTRLHRTLDAAGIVQLCRKLTLMKHPPETLYDTAANFHPSSLRNLSSTCQLMNITDQIISLFQLANITLTGDETVVLEKNNTLESLCELVQEYLLNYTLMPVLYDFAFWRMYSASAPFLANKLSRPILNNFDDRQRYCESLTARNLPNYVGSLYVTKYYPNYNREPISQMFQAIRSAARKILESLNWMSIQSKKEAIHKVNIMAVEIGYNDDILNYTYLESYFNYNFNQSKFFDNVMVAKSVQLQIKLAQIHGEIKEFFPPHLVNAYYNPVKNAVHMLLGILQGVLMNRQFPPSMNFGGIGLVLGHELGHGFDDDGRKMDFQGMLRQWWDNETIQSYEQRAQCFVKQYGTYSINGHNINGDLTIGENIADNFGLKLSYRAFKQLETEGVFKSAKKLPGVDLNFDQLFFTSFATVWCEKQHEDNVLDNLLTDTHSPGKFRVIGTLSNSQEFAEAFHCPKESPMNPSHKCTLF